MCILGNLAGDHLGTMHGILIASAVQASRVNEAVTVFDIEIVARHLSHDSKRLRLGNAIALKLVPHLGTNHTDLV
jgi:hypothetical protein